MTNAKISFDVLGVAKSAGSKRAMPIYRKGANGRQLVTRPNGSPVIVVTDDNPKSKEWKNEVRAAARAAYRGPVLRGAIRLTLRFIRNRPKGHYGKGKNAARIKAGAEPHPIAKPDVLKLARGVEDALTGVCWADDAQIVDECLVKCWGEPARVEVTIEPLDLFEQEALQQRLLDPVSNPHFNDACAQFHYSGYRLARHGLRAGGLHGRARSRRAVGRRHSAISSAGREV
jgi:Holliday junction resolvase RusA-like endonuclease